jgi:hypothetical protein
MKPEEKVKAIIKQHLTSLPRCYWFMPASNGFGRAGVPDFVGHINGKFFAIEAKAEGGRVTALQTREIDKINATGGYAIVVKGIEQAKQLNLTLLGIPCAKTQKY